MPTIQELHEMHLRHLDATLAESSLLLQREGGLDGELKTSGAICERFVKDTLRRFFVPGHFRLTSGFIATPRLLRDRLNLPQCDILIVDEDTPPLLRFDDSDIEVVPREAVCGIIEVKRSLTVRTLGGKSPQSDAGALGHLAAIVKSLDVADCCKTDVVLNMFNRHIGFHNHSSNKPLMGVIALQNQLSDFQVDAEGAIRDSESLTDFIWTLDGYALLPAFREANALYYYSHTARPLTRAWQALTANDFAMAPSEFYRSYSGRPVWAVLRADSENSGRARVFAKVLGVVSLMLSRVTSRPLQENEISEYYLRDD